MKIKRIQLSRPVHTPSHGMTDEYDGANFDFLIDDGFVLCTRRSDGSTVAYPREMCVLTIEPQQKKA